MEHTAPDTSPLTCPFCEASGLKDFGRNAARCGACGGVLGGDFLESLRGIVALPDTHGRHACDNASAWLVVTPPRLLRKAMSSFGNASGHRRARMPMYCAAHGPMPGSSVSRRIVSSGR